jgi:hypothetical protein
MLESKEKPTITFLKNKKKNIEETLAGSEPATNAAIAYKNAKAYSKSQNFDRFKVGAIEELNKMGSQRGGKNISAEKRPLKLKSEDSADDFIRALGEDGQRKAGDIMLRHYADDMARNVKIDDTGLFKTAMLNDWVSKNKRVLDKYGIAQFFDDVNTAHKSVAAARNAETTFNKSIADKMLNADADSVIEQMFKGGEGINAKNTQKIMATTMDKLKGNPKAIKGLENSFQEFLYKKMETTAVTIKGELDLSKAALTKAMRKYKPAIKELYKGQPGKIKALQTVEQALTMSNRSLSSPLKGGSDTAEKIGPVAKVIGAIASNLPGGGTGLKLAKLGLENFKNLNSEELNKMVVRLIHDPDLAEIIIAASRKRLPPEIIKRRLEDYMLIHGIRAGVEKTQQEEDK